MNDELFLQCLKRQCYYFRDGRILYDSILRQGRRRLKNYMMLFDSSRRNENFIMECICWSQTKESGSFWNTRYSELNIALRKYGGTLKLPNRCREKFIEVQE